MIIDYLFKVSRDFFALYYNLQTSNIDEYKWYFQKYLKLWKQYTELPQVNGKEVSQLYKWKFNVYEVRSSCSVILFKIGVLKNFANLTGKHLCQSRFFNKTAGLRHVIFLKKRLWRRCFLLNFAKSIRTHFLIRTPPVAASFVRFSRFLE